MSGIPPVKILLNLPPLLNRWKRVNHCNIKLYYHNYENLNCIECMILDVPRSVWCFETANHHK